MKASIEWLNEFTPIKIDARDLGERMTISGSKVEAIDHPGEAISLVVTGKIIALEPHQNSDHLLVCQVDIGQPEPLQIVTGAPNTKLGTVVPVALHGATLAHGVKIKKGKLRGVASNGMMCSVQELGFTPQEFPDAAENGLYILPENTPVGVDIHSVLGLDDTIIDFEITSNRPDCFSVEGLGREAALTLQQTFTPVTPQVVGRLADKSSELLQVVNDCPELCAVYYGRVVMQVTIKPSPFWMQRRLRACGIRPINNIVDITNYVMQELGQPMHAFDLEDIRDGEIHIRKAEPGETLVTLDEVKRPLDDKMLVIADTNQALAVAGVMGGALSGIHPDTQTIVFEAACFDAASVRRTSSRLGLRTEASAHFEKGLDWHNTLRALNRACELVEQLGCGEVSADWTEAKGLLTEPTDIVWSPESINAFLGTQIEAGYMYDILAKLGCVHLTDPQSRPARLTPPSFRPDLSSEADLAEEVARFYGYNKIKPTLLSGKQTTLGGLTREQSLTETIKNTCIALGYYEAITYTFESARQLDRLGVDQDSPLRRQVWIRNAGENVAVMRTSLLPSMLQVLNNNASRGSLEAALFEVGTCFFANNTLAGELPDEKPVLIAARYNLAEKSDSGQAFYQLKGLLEEVFTALGLGEPILTSQHSRTPYHPYRYAEVAFKQAQETTAPAPVRVCGSLAYLHPETAREFDVPEQTAVLQLQLPIILAHATQLRRQKPLPKFPAVLRDIAVVVNKAVEAGSLLAAIRQAGAPILSSARVFDVYTGKPIPTGQKSIAFELAFRQADRTLTENEVNEKMKHIFAILKDRFDAKLR
ncbi:MAG: phenylalanine--tRNA ligase subunit beta [Oscillospiraceae bacterium]|nr:phenylalanine--tRNA ligase subunit beta [Oscillospiraceae bacterium]MDD4369071.1 phenylalanine--tRNA ligase subunit beta [Oscillospiraceae bacterium]